MDISKYLVKKSVVSEPYTSKDNTLSDVGIDRDDDCNSGDDCSEQVLNEKTQKICKTTEAKREQVKRSKQNMTFNPRLQELFPWVYYDSAVDGAFCTVCRKWGKPPPQTHGMWTTVPFTMWKKAKEKMKEHAKSKWHKRACETAVQYETSQQHGTVVQVAQTAALKQRQSNRAVILKLIKCTYFLVKDRIAHTTNFSNLVELVSSCGAEDLQRFTHDEVQRNAKYTSSTAVTDFISAIASFIRSKLLASISRSKFFTLMADECTDVSSTEELSICCQWLENGKPVEHFIDIIHITEMKAAAITTVLTEFMSSHGIDVRQMRGMGFDGAATFSGKKSGVQTRLENLSLHAIYLHWGSQSHIAACMCPSCQHHSKHQESLFKFNIPMETILLFTQKSRKTSRGAKCS